MDSEYEDSFGISEIHPYGSRSSNFETRGRPRNTWNSRSDFPTESYASDEMSMRGMPIIKHPRELNYGNTGGRLRDSEIFAEEGSPGTEKTFADSRQFRCSYLGVLAISCVILTIGTYLLFPRVPVLRIKEIDFGGGGPIIAFTLNPLKMQSYMQIMFAMENSNYFPVTLEEFNASIFWSANNSNFMVGSFYASKHTFPATSTSYITINANISHAASNSTPANQDAIFQDMLKKCPLSTGSTAQPQSINFFFSFSLGLTVLFIDISIPQFKLESQVDCVWKSTDLSTDVKTALSIT